MRKVITTMLVASMILSMAMPASAATITRKKSTSGTSSTTKVSGDYSLKMVDKTLQFIRGGKVVSSIETKDGKITLRKSSAGGISVVFTDANGKRRNITLGKQTSVKLSGTFTQVSVDKALGSSFDVEMEKGSKVTNFYAKGAAKVTLNGSVTTLNVTSSNANVAANGTVSRAYAVNKKAISGMSAGKITQTSTGTSASGSVNTSGSGSSSSSNTTVNSGSGSGSSSSGGSSGIIINGGGSSGDSTAVAAPKITQQPVSVEIEEGKSATLTIKATATGKISYQWYDAKTGKAIAGETSNTLKVTPKESTSYYCMVTNTVGSKKSTVRSNTVTVTIKGQVVVVEKPVITKQPEAQTVEVDTETTLSVEVKAVAGLTPKYQWYTVDNNGTTPVNTAISGETSATLKVTPKEAGTVNYFCKVINVNAKGVESDATDSDIVGITATPKTANEDLKAAKDAVVALMNKEYESLDVLKKAIEDAAAKTGVKADVSKLAEKDGVVTGDILLTKDNVEETATVAFTATIAKKDADLTAAKAAVDAELDKITPANDVTEDALKAAVAAGVKDFEGVTGTVTEFNKVDATADTEGSITAKITLSKEGAEDLVWTFTKTIPATGAVTKLAFVENLQKPASVGEDGILTLSDTDTVLSVKTNSDNVSYQWFKSTASNGSNGKAISGATSASYTITQADATNDLVHFYVEATNKADATDKIKSDLLKLNAIKIPDDSAIQPIVSILPTAEQKFELGDSKAPVLTVSVSNDGTITTAGGTLSYKWFDIAYDNNGNPAAPKEIANETNATFTAPINQVGAHEYYCVVTNTNEEAAGLKTATAQTASVKVTVANTNSMATADTTMQGNIIKVFLTGEELGNLTKDDILNAIKVEGTYIDGEGKKASFPMTIDNSFHDKENGKVFYQLEVSGFEKFVDDKGDAYAGAKVRVSLPQNIGETTFNPYYKDFDYEVTNPTDIEITKFEAVAPVASAGTPDPETSQVTVTFNKPLTVNPKANEFGLTFYKGTTATSTVITPDKVAISGNTVTLDIKLSSNKDETKLKLTKAPVAPPATLEMVDVVRDTKAPVMTKATLDQKDRKITVQFSENIVAAGSATPAADDFQIVEADGTTEIKDGNNQSIVDATAPTISGNSLTFFVTTLPAGEGVSVKYVGKSSASTIGDKATAQNTLALNGTIALGGTQAAEPEAIKPEKAIVTEPKPAANGATVTDASGNPVTATTIVTQDATVKMAEAFIVTDSTTGQPVDTNSTFTSFVKVRSDKGNTYSVQDAKVAYIAPEAQNGVLQSKAGTTPGYNAITVKVNLPAGESISQIYFDFKVDEATGTPTTKEYISTVDNKPVTNIPPVTVGSTSEKVVAEGKAEATNSKTIVVTLTKGSFNAQATKDDWTVTGLAQGNGVASVTVSSNKATLTLSSDITLGTNNDKGFPKITVVPKAKALTLETAEPEATITVLPTETFLKDALDAAVTAALTKITGNDNSSNNGPVTVEYSNDKRILTVTATDTDSNTKPIANMTGTGLMLALENFLDGIETSGCYAKDFSINGVVYSSIEGVEPLSSASTTKDLNTAFIINFGMGILKNGLDFTTVTMADMESKCSPLVTSVTYAVDGVDGMTFTVPYTFEFVTDKSAPLMLSMDNQANKAEADKETSKDTDKKDDITIGASDESKTEEKE